MGTFSINIYIYHLEASLREQNADWDKRYQARQELALPILKQLGSWLKVQYPQVLPRSAIGKAIHYSLKRWNLLCRYTEHGGVEIDNNLIENQIRPLALGRKNYLFAVRQERSPYDCGALLKMREPTSRSRLAGAGFKLPYAA